MTAQMVRKPQKQITTKYRISNTISTTCSKCNNNIHKFELCYIDSQNNHHCTECAEVQQEKTTKEQVVIIKKDGRPVIQGTLQEKEQSREKRDNLQQQTDDYVVSVKPTIAYMMKCCYNDC